MDLRFGLLGMKQLVQDLSGPSPLVKIFTRMIDYDKQPEEANDGKCVERVPERKRPDHSPGHLVEAHMNKILDVWSKNDCM